MIDVQFPAKLRPLFSPSRFKSIRGGRDGAKSWSIAGILIEIASASPQWLIDQGLYCGCDEFIVCARENMNSMADSVHRLLQDTIERLGVQRAFDIGQAKIRNTQTNAEFVFKGLLHNPASIKSLEGATRLWVEEAQAVSDDSWRQAIPTIRKPNSEVWLTWNPKLETDATWKRFVLDPPPGLVDIEMNFSDNPWASEVLRPEREKMQRDDPDEYAHVWRGKPRRMLAGAMYANEIRLAEEQGRIGKFPYNPALPVDTGWDLGDSDLCCIWFLQRSMGQYRAIDYMEDNHKPLSHYLSEIEAKGYTRGKAYFPWDASSKMLVGSLEETMRQRGQTVVVMPRQPRAAGIDAAREMLGTCWFNLTTTDDGINRLRYYRQAPTKIIDPVTGDTVMSMQPVHDANSHGADAFRTIAMGYRRPVKVEKPKPVSAAPRRYVPPPTAWS